ncbi:thioredoxin domain-containing protein [Streptomyces decoyicus]|uniref:Thioredoxin domain-containing protein n=1 Tax=Streptomyces decoyicus TaxID=249567 RepID=A0ABZ1FGL8_9ACTN|nr:thioredoxin domain-containing protein [Streptomyces decoyicus]
MTNRLAHETSPCLLQHADNPVDWWPWSADAFEEARRRGVPVLLSAFDVCWRGSSRRSPSRGTATMQ